MHASPLAQSRRAVHDSPAPPPDSSELEQPQAKNEAVHTMLTTPSLMRSHHNSGYLR